MVLDDAAADRLFSFVSMLLFEVVEDIARDLGKAMLWAMKYGDIVECFWSAWNFDDALFEEVATSSLFEISTSNSDKFSSLATYFELK